MAMMPMMPLQKDFKWKDVATAAANQTWGAQLASLKSAFANLSADEKEKTRLRRGNGQVFTLSNAGNGMYFRVYDGISGGSVVGMDGMAVTINTSIASYIEMRTTGTTATDSTSSNNSSTLTLQVLANL